MLQIPKYICAIVIVGTIEHYNDSAIAIKMGGNQILC